MKGRTAIQYTEHQGPEAARTSDSLYATFLMLNDGYLPGALVLADGLRRQGTTTPLVCLTTDGVSDQAREALGLLFDDVVDVDRIYVPHARRQERQDRPYYFTRIQVLRLGRDGDLGFSCSKVVVIDADVLPLCRYDELLELPAPAGILNERKENLVEVDESGRHVVREETRVSGEWRWHRIYRECPHGAPVPRAITDRVSTDPTNMGINGSLFVMAPDRGEFERILEDVRSPQIAPLVGDAFDWPDMQYLTMAWSGRWTSIDVRFSSLSGYPSMDLLYGSHFAGFKPWYFQREAAMRRYIRFPDFQCWFRRYREMVERYPALVEMGKLRRLDQSIAEALGDRKETPDTTGRRSTPRAERGSGRDDEARTKKGSRRSKR